MRKVLEKSERSYQNRFIGKHMSVLWESEVALDPVSWRLQGLTDNYLRVSAVTPKRLWNQIQLVEITGTNGMGLTGKVVEPAGIRSTSGNW